MRFAVYECRRCRHAEVIEINEHMNSPICGLCGATLDDSDRKHESESEEEALARLSSLVRSRIGRTVRPRPRHGLGVRRRLIDIVTSLIELNRGRPVSVAEVLSESESAGLSLEKTRVFLERLEMEGVLTVSDGRVTLSGGGKQD